MVFLHNSDRTNIVMTMCLYVTIIFLSTHVNGNTNWETNPLTHEDEHEEYPDTGAELGAEENLVISLMNRRSLSVRPQTCPSCKGALSVYITYNVIQILALSQSEETLSISGWFTTRWEDYRLTWNASQHANVRQVFLPSHKVWIPDIGVMNGKDNNDFDFSTKSQSRLSVTSEGRVEWLHGVILDVTCPLNVTNFPFDIQTCHLILTPWQSHVHQFIIKPMQLGSTVDNSYLPNSNVSEWEILSVEFLNHQYKSQFNLTYQYMVITITLKRQPLYFVILVLIPFGMLSILASLIFTLNETGDRLSVALSLVLSMTMYVVIVASNAPRSMRTLPVLCIYLLNQLGLLCCATVLSVITQKMREYNPLMSFAAAPERRECRDEYPQMNVSPPSVWHHRSPFLSKHSPSPHSSQPNVWLIDGRQRTEQSYGSKSWQEELSQETTETNVFPMRPLAMGMHIANSDAPFANQIRTFRNYGADPGRDSPVEALKHAWNTPPYAHHKKSSLERKQQRPFHGKTVRRLFASKSRLLSQEPKKNVSSFGGEYLMPNEGRVTPLATKQYTDLASRIFLSQLLDRCGLFMYLLLSCVNAIICLIIVPRQ